MKTLLVDTNRAAVPIYQSLLELGHDVWVVGSNPNESLALLAKKYIQLDYSNINDLVLLIEREKFDFLVPGCTDLSYLVCCEVNERLGRKFKGLECLETNEIINQKNKFRFLCNSLNVSAPSVLSFDMALKKSKIIIKPVDSFSGRGIHVLQNHNKNDLETKYNQARAASKTDTVIIEEFVSGQLYSHSAFLKNGKLEIDFIVQEDCSANPFVVDTSRVTADLNKQILQSIRNDIEKISKELSLSDGLIHTQFIVNEQNYWLIEMTRRCPGDLYSKLIELSTGYQYAKNYAASFLGNEIEAHTKNTIKRNIVRHTVTSEDGESFWGLQFKYPLKINLYVQLTISGSYLNASPFGRAGVVFIEADTVSEQDKIYKDLLDRSLYRFGI